MRILVCGGRDYVDNCKVTAELDAIHAEKPVTELIHGAARGADSLAAAWAKSRGIPARAFPADWKRHGKSAGYIRNTTMLHEGNPDMVIAFPGGSGTGHMIQLAESKGFPVKKITNN